MMITENKATQIDDLLDRMAAEVQLDKSRNERMISSYGHVKEWIESDEKFFRAYSYDVYPHGSVRIRTTVKPMGSDEFDLDIAVHLKQNTPHTPEKIYRELNRRLSENGRFKDIMELKNRCIRLNYSGDYHIDILPGIQELEYDHNRLIIPDRQLGAWVSSNPRGYADWFIKKANTVKVSLLQKAMSAENLPSDDFESKKPLQRAVQLIKRYRDIYFQENSKYRTSSIILTTIAGELYRGEDSIFQTVDNIVTLILESVHSLPERLKVLNPVNPAEDFTDKWDAEPGYYEAFKSFARHLNSEWQKLKKDNGVQDEGDIFKGLFGDDIFKHAQIGQTKLIEQMRQTRAIGASRQTGMLSSLSTGSIAPIKPNTFFGD